MPKNERQTYKQELERAIGNIDWAVEHLRRVAETYRPHHEEVSEVCEVACVGLVTAQEVMKALQSML